MIYNKHSALESLKLGADWSWVGFTYSDLNWQDSSTKPTESEIDAEVTRLTNAEPMRLLRVERNAKLSACDWRASSDLTLSDSWKTYRQALRDLPETADPYVDEHSNIVNVIWPEVPV